jgi:hypothetical protein
MNDYRRLSNFARPNHTTAILSQFTNKSGLFFPARGKATRTFYVWSKSKIALDGLSGVANWTLHGLRSTFRTIHARIGRRGTSYHRCHSTPRAPIDGAICAACWAVNVKPWHPGQRRHVSGPVAHRAGQGDDRRLAFGEAVEVAHTRVQSSGRHWES